MEEIYTELNSMFVGGLTNGLFSILITIVIALLLNHGLNVVIKKYNNHNKNNIIRIKNLIIIIFVVGLCLLQISSLQNLARTLLASSGIIAVIIGFASQEAASNLINGLIIMIYHPYKIGDFIDVKEYGVRGYVVDIALRHTIIETLEKTKKIIPNSIMNKTVIENISETKYKINYLVIDISYTSNLEKAKQIIAEEALKHPLYKDNRSKKEIKEKVDPIKIYCLDFKDSGINLRADIPTLDNSKGFELLSDLRLSIKKRFDEEGIEIPYQQIVIHQK